MKLLKINRKKMINIMDNYIKLLIEFNPYKNFKNYNKCREIINLYEKDKNLSISQIFIKYNSIINQNKKNLFPNLFSDL